MAELRDANSNPWYVLMTLYGEQDHVDPEVNRKRAEENRAVWNAWSCQGLDDVAAAVVAKQAGVDLAETRGWAEMAAEVTCKHREEMKKRNKDSDFTYPGFPDFKIFIECSGIKFLNQVVLMQCIFSNYVHFSSAAFAQNAIFNSAVFVDVADFSSASFAQNTDFVSATFTQDADFRSASFTQNAYFSSATFTQDATFNSATFTQNAYFSSATFTQDAYFSVATFTQDANFNSATFTQYADFSMATFTQGAYFRSATFTQYADFRSATFTQYAEFRSANFEGPATFVEAKFGVRGGGKACRADFTEAAFAKVVSFREAEFVSHYPKLEGTQFREGVVLSAKAAFWPNEGKGATMLNERTAERAKESCAALRHALAKQGLPEEEHFFFRREMEFTRQVEWAAKDAGWLRFKAWPYWLFKVFSGYGASIALPVRALGELFLLGAVALFGFFLPTLGWFKAIGLAASMSFSNLLPLFGFSRTFFKDALLDLPWGLQVLAGAQTVFALPILFFLGLALRKRFRLR